MFLVRDNNQLEKIEFEDNEPEDSTEIDYYFAYLRFVETRKNNRRNDLAKFSEEEIQQMVSDLYSQINLKQVMIDLCLDLGYKYDFRELKKYLIQIPDTISKLKILITLKYDFKRDIEMIKGMPYTKDYLSSSVLDFENICQQEIDKFTAILHLESSAQQTTPEQIPQTNRREGINIERTFLFFEYLFTAANATTNKTKRNKIIELLTGYKIGQLAKLPSWFERQKLEVSEKDEIGKKFFDDMKEVQNLFISLGLTEIADSIEKDLGG